MIWQLRRERSESKYIDSLTSKSSLRAGAATLPASRDLYGRGRWHRNRALRRWHRRCHPGPDVLHHCHAGLPVDFDLPAPSRSVTAQLRHCTRLWMPSKRALYYCCTHSITGPCRQASGMDAQIVNGSADAARTDLVVMLKAPANSKRRLAAEIGDHAGEVAAHLLNCALVDASAWPGSTWLSPANRRDRNWLMTEMETESTLPRAFRPGAGWEASPSGPVTTKNAVSFAGLSLNRARIWVNA